jgi:hypothetical protein
MVHQKNYFHAFLSVFCVVLACTPSPSKDVSDAGPIENEDAGIASQSDGGSNQNNETVIAGLADLFSTDEITLVEGPLDCISDANLLCGIFKARIKKADTPSVPVGNEGLDERAMPINIVLVVRAKTAQALHGKRWVVFDAGGYGNGYASGFGKVAPSEWVTAGEGFGDDLILSYVNAGYVTVDMLYQYPKGLEDAADPHSLGDWIPEYNKGTAWFRNLNGSTFVGTATRSRAVYAWAYQNGGNQKVCAHAHSSGSGRLIGALTRLHAADLFDTIVFDGGPVFAYMPWICAIDDGPLGARPSNLFDTTIDSANGVTPLSISCAHTLGNSQESCTYNYCYDAEWHEGLRQDSFFISATQTDFPDLDLGVVMGGEDDSNAFVNLALWLGGATGTDGEVFPYLTARSITFKQGYCDSSVGRFLGDYPCSNWSSSNLPSVDNSITYDPRLKFAEHGTTDKTGGMTVVQEVMLEHCELVP